MALSEQIDTDQQHATASISYTLRGPGDVQRQQSDVMYEATVTNMHDYPVALRAYICPESGGHFVIQTTSLTRTVRDSGAFTMLDDAGCAWAQGILWQRGDSFTWHITGDISKTARGEWQTTLVIDASYLTSGNGDEDEWVSLDMPAVRITTQVQ